MSWKSVFVCFALACLLMAAFRAYDEHLNDLYPIHPVKTYNPPAVLSTPAQMLYYGAWTRREYHRNINRILYNDRTCAVGIDYSQKNAGRLCLP